VPEVDYTSENVVFEAAITPPHSIDQSDLAYILNSFAEDF